MAREQDNTGSRAEVSVFASNTNGTNKSGEKSIYIKKQKAELLASMYPRWKRIMETCSLIAWTFLNVFVFYRALSTMDLAKGYWLLPVALFGGMVRLASSLISLFRWRKRTKKKKKAVSVLTLLGGCRFLLGYRSLGL
jgi:hypothetical protein